MGGKKGYKGIGSGPNDKKTPILGNIKSPSRVGRKGVK